MWRASKAVLVARPILGVVGVSLDQVGHAVLGTATVDNLLTGVVRVHDVGPGHIAEIPAFLQLFHRLTDLRNRDISAPIHSSLWPPTFNPNEQVFKGKSRGLTAPVFDREIQVSLAKQMGASIVDSHYISSFAPLQSMEENCG